MFVKFLTDKVRKILPKNLTKKSYQKKWSKKPAQQKTSTGSAIACFFSFPSTAKVMGALLGTLPILIYMITFNRFQTIRY